MRRVLDQGFVHVVDHMGSDLSVVNAARISFGKRKAKFDEKDTALIAYLAEHEHTAPFRHAFVTFHIKAPIFVLRQWMKHVVGCSWNEISGRYVEFEPEFYLPEDFRLQSTNNKQGSHGRLGETDNANTRIKLSEGYNSAYCLYREMLANGVCREQARLILPLATYSEVYWTASLQAIAHFLHLRLDSHAQKEIREYATAVKEQAQNLFPEAMRALFPEGSHA